MAAEKPVLSKYRDRMDKAIAALKQHDAKTAAEAHAMLDTGIKGERLVRGEPTSVTETRAIMRANIQVLEVVVADVLRALMDTGQIDSRAARQFAETFAAKINEAPFRYQVEG